MLLSYRNLDSETRRLMLGEVERDTDDGVLNFGKRLNEEGEAVYPELLRQAIQGYDDEWLANQFRQGGRMKLTEQRRKPSGGVTTVPVARTAPETFAQGEFNRFYIRALCLRAIAEGRKLVVYRARQSSNPRPESQALIGTSPDTERLLYDLRVNIGVDTVLGLPQGPNSGLSVELTS